MNPSNFSSISFPFLGLEVNPPRTLSVGPLTAHYYGLIIAIGLNFHPEVCVGLTENVTPLDEFISKL